MLMPFKGPDQTVVIKIVKWSKVSNLSKAVPET